MVAKIVPKPNRPEKKIGIKGEKGGIFPKYELI